MPDTFQLGTTSTLTDIETTLSGPNIIEPDWDYRPFTSIIELNDGTTQGNGFPVVRWQFNQLSLAHRELLRETYCPSPALSAEDIYLHTPITETDNGELIWKTFKGILHWTPEEEDFQADRNLGVLLVFTHLEEQEEEE